MGPSPEDAADSNIAIVLFVLGLGYDERSER